MKKAVVIGSGAGGLASALLLAGAGWEVTVLEQHLRAGGFLHRFFREGRGYDTGFHYIGSWGPHQLLGRLLNHLGIYKNLEWLELNPQGFDHLWFPHTEVRVPQGRDHFYSRLLQKFPAQRAGLDHYFETHQQAVSAYGWYNLDLSTPPEAVLPWEERSLSEVLDSCIDDPRLKALLSGQSALYGVPPKEAPFGLHAVVTDHLLKGAARIRGGGDQLALAMVRRLRTLGGRIFFGQAATDIEVVSGAAVAVHTQTHRFGADLVIANLHPQNVLALLPEGAVRPAYRNRVMGARVGRAHVGVYLSVEGDLSPLKGCNLYRFQEEDPTYTSATPEQVPFYFLTAPGAEAASASEQGVVLGLIPVDWSQVSAWRGQRDHPDYLQFKQHLKETFVGAIHQDFPGWTVKRAEVSTPLTTERYTRSPEGAAYGHYHSVAQMGRYRLPMRIKVPNLLQVGQCIGFPGVCGALISAYSACGEVLGASHLIEELRRG
jgi:all-trans-retinol 13,14-reductase